jgi:predicted metal-dependent RNase
MGKKNDKIRVRFVGHASHEVTGSCIHIQTETKQILLECGLAQSCESPLALYKKNAADMGFKPRQIDYIFIGHPHADHISLIPRLFKKGCSAQVIAPSGGTS